MSPLQQCTVDGKAGWQWGNGKCHVGRHGKERAEAEGVTEPMGVMDDIGVAHEKDTPVTKAETKSVPTVKTEAPIKRKRGPAKKKTTE